MPEPNPDQTTDFQPISDLGQTQEIHTDTRPIPLAGDESPNKTLIKLTQLGDFKLNAKPGQGGMDSVYKAVQVSKNRFVALKVLNMELATKPTFVARFHREVRVMGRLNHPNLISSFAAGDSHGFLYLAMELVEGGTLGDWISKLKCMTPADAVTLTLGIANGLQYAHEAGLIHRDIKPDNVLLTKSGIPKISDLGLAKNATENEEQGLTQTGIGIGTPLYAPLEQIKDAKNVDARCDIFALGGVLYMMLVGKPPFEAETMLGMIKAKDKGTYPLPSIAKPGVPAILDRIMIKMLAKLPDQRYSSCMELIEDLQATGLATEKASFFP